MNLLSPYLNPYLFVHYYDLKSILKSTLISNVIRLKSIKMLGRSVYGFKDFFIAFKDIFFLWIRKSPAKEIFEINYSSSKSQFPYEKLHS